jgi:phosphate transport system substrate-binding protein
VKLCCTVPTAIGILAAMASGQSLDKASQEATQAQNARATSVTSKGKKTFYTNRWDLSGLPHYKPERHVSGTIREWGSNYFTDGLLAGYWESEFRKYQPDVQFDDHLKTSEHAISALCFGVSDIGPLGRQIMWDEMTAFERQFSYLPTGIRVVTGSYDVSGWNPAIGVFVNKDNPISKLSLRQLDGIFGAERSGGWTALTWNEGLARGSDKNIRAWGQLGLTGDWADKPIHAYGYNLLFHFPMEIASRAFGGTTNKWNEHLIEYANKVTPEGKLKLAGELMMEDLAKDPYAIAYIAGGTLWQTPQTRSVALGEQDAGPFYELNIENVRSRRYPFYADVFFVINRDPAKPLDPKVKEYLRYILSREGQEQVMHDGKYLPLTNEVVREELKKLE